MVDQQSRDPILVEILPPAPYPPIASPVVVTEHVAVVPHPAGGEAIVAHEEGIHLAWTPMSADHALLVMCFGRTAASGIALRTSRAGIRALATHLTAIADQLEGGR